MMLVPRRAIAGLGCIIRYSAEGGNLHRMRKASGFALREKEQPTVTREEPDAGQSIAPLMTELRRRGKAREVNALAVAPPLRLSGWREAASRRRPGGGCCMAAASGARGKLNAQISIPSFDLFRRKSKLMILHNMVSI